MTRFRPNRSDSRAQKGEVTVQSRADRANAPATKVSDSRNSRPMAGSTDCSAILPAAAVRLTANSIMKAGLRGLMPPA